MSGHVRDEAETPAFCLCRTAWHSTKAETTRKGRCAVYSLLLPWPRFPTVMECVAHIAAADDLHFKGRNNPGLLQDKYVAKTKALLTPVTAPGLERQFLHSSIAPFYRPRFFASWRHGSKMTTRGHPDQAPRPSKVNWLAECEPHARNLSPWPSCAQRPACAAQCDHLLHPQALSGRTRFLECSYHGAPVQPA